MRLVTVFLSVCLLLSGCGSDSTPTGPGGGSGGGGTGGDGTIHLDPGSSGLVVDLREIFRMGYVPSEVEFAFADHARFDTTLTVDPALTSVAFQVHNDELSEAEKQEFSTGVQLDISVRDGAGTVLATRTSPSQILSSSNVPVVLNTTLPRILPPLALRSDLAYLIQPELSTGVLQDDCSDCYSPMPYIPDDIRQQFYFEAVPGGGPDRYHIRHEGHNEGNYMYVWSANGQHVVGLRGGVVAGDPEVFVLEQDDEGYVRIRHERLDLYVYVDTIDLRLNATGDRFRLLSDRIEWTVEDRGTLVNQPILPPARLDFAYTGTLRNCSSAQLDETVGRVESRTRTTTVSTSESIEVFAGSTKTSSTTVGVEVGAKVGFGNENVAQASEEVTFSEDFSWETELTRSTTTTSSTTWEESVERTVEVSRERTVSVGPFTVVEVKDAIKTMEDIRLPFTQRLRLRGTDRDTTQPLTGEELLAQMWFNRATAVPTTIGPDYLDVTVRGLAVIDKVFDASTVVREIEGGCDN